MTWTKDRNLFWALAAFGGVAVTCLILALLRFADQMDTAAKAREEAVVSNGYIARVHEVERLAVPNLVWDEAVINIDNRFNRAWVEDNIGVYYHSMAGFQLAFVLDADNQPLYAMRNGEHQAPQTFSRIASATHAIVAEVRRLEAERQRQNVAPQYNLDHPIQASTTLWLGDWPYIVTASLVAPDFGRARIRHAQAPVVITGRALDQDFQSAFADRYLLSDLHLHEGDSRFEPNEAHALVHNFEGQEIATFDWTPQTPGAHLVRGGLPGMVGTVVLLLVLTIVLYVRARGHARQLAVSEQRASHMAYHDALTGVGNRARLEEVLAVVLARAQRGDGGQFALHLVDLDNFKDINDTSGHHTGDEILKIAAERLTALCEDDALCARLGGDEFALLHPVESGAEAGVMATRIVRVLSEPFVLREGVKILSCSVGTVLTSGDQRVPLEVLRRADLALYRAKADGRACARAYTTEMDELLQVVQRLKDDLRADLAAGKFFMVYQPQVRLSGEVVGVEALVRWTHDRDGPISPSIFVPLAEECGLIKQLGEFTLRQAAQDSLRWPGLKVAVNVSATQFQDGDFIADATRIVSEAGASCSNIEIELTEGVLFRSEAETRAALDGLRAAGFSIALDDFGTGYSSLSYLQRFPIDKIKIDRSFVAALGEDPKADALFTAIVRLANALDMRVIAEGVETQEQWLRLARAGCPKVQGFIASRPLAANEVQPFVDARKTEPRPAASVTYLPLNTGNAAS